MTVARIVRFPGRRRPVPQLINRDRVERMVDAALDFAERAIAVLDDLDGEPDREDDGGAEPSLASPERPEGPQLVWSRGGDADLEGGGGDAVAT